MNTAAVTTTPPVTAFLKQQVQHQGHTNQTLPAPPNHRCRNCGNELSPEEIKQNECWVCFGALEQDTAVDDDD